MSANTPSILLIRAGSCSPSMTTKERILSCYIHIFVNKEAKAACSLPVRPLGIGPTVFRTVMVNTECQLERFWTLLGDRPLGMC